MSEEKQTQDEPENGITFADENPRRNVYDLENCLNAYGRTIYVEERGEVPGKPKIWYEFNKQGMLMKSVRRPDGIFISNLGKTQYL